MIADHIHSLPDLITDLGRQHKARTAIGWSQRLGRPRMSYQELARLTETMAQAVAQRVNVGDRVIIDLEAGPLWCVACFGVMRAGAVAVPIITGLDTAARAQLTEKANTTLEVTAANIDELLSGKTQVDLKSPDPDATALIAFTSGSTGCSRGVELSHRGLLADLRAILAVRTPSPDDVFLSILPPAHLYEFIGGLLGPLACGSRVVYPGSLLPNRIVQDLRDEGITHALAVPALVQAIYAEVVDELVLTGVIEVGRRHQTFEQSLARMSREMTEGERERVRRGVRCRIGTTLRNIVVGGAAIDCAIAELLTLHGIRTEVGYGLTEAGPIVTVGTFGEVARGSVGTPLPGVTVKVDAQTHEILVHTPAVMRGYLHDQAATQAALQDGWLRTGDRGHLDPYGALFVDGRIKEAMVTATGETIHPEEFEPWYQSTQFAESCIAGVPDREGNDRPTLFVVPGAEPSDLDSVFAELRKRAPQRLRIRKMVCCDDPLPRTMSGKVRRRFIGDCQASTSRITTKQATTNPEEQ